MDFLKLMVLKITILYPFFKSAIPHSHMILPFGSVLSRPYLCHLQNNTSRTFLVNILFYRPECLFLHTHTLIPKIHHHLIICIAYGGFKAPTGIVLCLSFFHASPFTQKGQLQTTVCKLPSRCYNDCSFFLCFGTLFLCLCSASLVKAYIFLLCSITSADAIKRQILRLQTCIFSSN